MLPRSLLFLCSIATALATGECTNGIYNPPVGKSFMTVNTKVGMPYNVTTPNGIVAMVPILTGDISGQFNGNLIANLSAETERLLNSKNGTYSTVETRWVFDNDKGDRILADMKGLTTYSAAALHGFGTAYLSTEVEEFYWVNWELFLIEWQGSFNTGDAKFEFFQISTGGRKDGQPIPS
ncbi:hypothetical protein VE02_07969 [Pseudogymnoascus sp. 03VT05]|nr:hypothetical protein VE02_07969 [Pseudogymnoascus sp. 03VT05]